MQEKSEKKENQSCILDFGRHPFSGPSNSRWKTERMPLLERALCSFVFLFSFLFSVSACLLFVGSVLLFTSVNERLTRKVSERKWGAGARLAAGRLWPGPVSPLPGSWPLVCKMRRQLGQPLLPPSEFRSYLGHFESWLNGTHVASAQLDISNPESLKVGWTFTFFFSWENRQTN